LTLVSGKCRVLVEIKCSQHNLILGNTYYPGMCGVLLQEVQRHDSWLDWIWIQSFHDRYLRECRQLNSSVVLHKLAIVQRDLYLLGSVFLDLEGLHVASLTGAAYLDEFRVSSVNVLHSAVTPALVAQCHAAGLTIFVWTVDDPEAARLLLEMGIDGIISNCPRGILGDRQATSTT